MTSLPIKVCESHSNLDFVIFHSTQPRILLLRQAEVWSLPHVAMGRRYGTADVSGIAEAVQRQLGLSVTVLRCAAVASDESSHGVNATYTLENHDPNWALPVGAQWIGREELAELTLALPAQRPVIEINLAEAERGVQPELRAPWAKPGWFEQAAGWMQAHLARLGYTITSPIEQTKSWGISCILRVHTTAGDVYFKAIPPSSGGELQSTQTGNGSKTLPILFANEPLLMEALARFYPEHIPIPLAVDGQRRWMLLGALGQELHQNRDLAVWRETLTVLAHIQRASAERIDLWLAAGCLDRRLDVLATQIEPLLSDPHALADLNEVEMAGLRRLVPHLRALIDQLTGYRVPQTLVHGDLHAGNVALHKGTVAFFDWTDACVSHPFFDLVTLLDAAGQLADTPGAQMHLQDVYLAQWTAYEPMPRLLEAWALAKSLGALHQAISYQHIIASLEDTPRPELSGGLPFWLRKLLKSIAVSNN